MLLVAAWGNLPRSAGHAPQCNQSVLDFFVLDDVHESWLNGPNKFGDL